MLDIRCPVKCGQCCDVYWKDVIKSDVDGCPHVGEHGCKLLRDDMPEGCRSYACELCEAVLKREVELERARRISEQCLHHYPENWWQVI